MAGNSLYVLLLLCVPFVMALANVAQAKKAPCRSQCIQGPAGIPGNSGVPGSPGTPGCDGLDGEKGEVGARGPAGQKGDTGAAGPSVTAVKNWKQCVWKAADNKDVGFIKDCSFTKTHSNTALRVAYQGNLYLGGNLKCKRWFITFNGAECSDPMPIDAAIYSRHVLNDERHGSIEGYCGGIQKGQVRVGINIGNCPGYSGGDGHTGLKSVSRLMIEEVPPPSQ